MTPEYVKEQLSLHYLGIITALSNCHLIIPQYDFGIDVLISQTKLFTFNGKNRIYGTGKSVEIQLKCTTTKSVQYFSDETGSTYLKFDLDAKNYNDLIIRRKEGGQPLMLVLVVFFENEKRFIKLQQNFQSTNAGLHLNALAYWFYPEENDSLTTNVKTKRVEISSNNALREDFGNFIFKKFYA